jgi:hypothetical protein
MTCHPLPPCLMPSFLSIWFNNCWGISGLTSLSRPMSPLMMTYEPLYNGAGAACLLCKFNQMHQWDEWCRSRWGDSWLYLRLRGLSTSETHPLTALFVICCFPSEVPSVLERLENFSCHWELPGMNRRTSVTQAWLCGWALRCSLLHSGGWYRRT